MIGPSNECERLVKPKQKDLSRPEVVPAQEVRHSRQARHLGGREQQPTIRKVRRSISGTGTDPPISMDRIRSTPTRSWRPSRTGCPEKRTRSNTGSRFPTISGAPATAACRRPSTPTRRATAASDTTELFRR